MQIIAKKEKEKVHKARLIENAVAVAYAVSVNSIYRTTEPVDSLESSCVSFRTQSQGWCQKSSSRGTRASDKGVRITKNAVFIRHFAKFPPTRT